MASRVSRPFAGLCCVALAFFAAACSGPFQADEPEPTYRVYYEANGAEAGAVPLDSSSYTKGSAAKVLGNSGGLARPGRYFACWNEAADGNGRDYQPGSSLALGGCDARLYAKWAVIMRRVGFDSAGGSAVEGTGVADGALVPRPADPVKAGFHFAGWFRDEALEEAWDFGAATATADMTLRAKWAPILRRLSFDSRGGSSVAAQEVADGGLAIRPADPSRYGYSFAGWFGDEDREIAWDFGSDRLGADATLYADWLVKYYSLAFDSRGGGSVEVQSVAEGSLAARPVDPSRLDYFFAGWFRDEACLEAWDFAADRVEADATLVAAWRLSSYPVSFDSAGGSAVTSQRVAPGGLAEEPPAPTRDGYRFLEWRVAEGGSNRAWDFGSDPVDGPVSLTAAWVELVRLTYDPNRATAGSVPGQVVRDAGASVAVAAKPADLERIDSEGVSYRFTGWNRAADGSGEHFDAGSSSLALAAGSGETVLYAEWAAYAIGDTGPAGGLIFYVASSYAAGWRYMEAAPADQAPAAYGPRGYDLGLTNTSAGEGLANTRILVDREEAYPAAQECYDLELGGYDDWFLPCTREVFAMYYNLYKAGLGAFAEGGVYICSNEYANVSQADMAYTLAFTEAWNPWPHYKDLTFNVRAARRF